jgi:hypothetical protein
MKKMVLTGLGSEQKFNSIPEDDGTTRHEKLGSAEFYLVFNEGELRVPVSEEAAHVVVQHMYGSGTQEHEEPQEAQDDSPALSPPDSDNGSDEDGVDQI